MEELLLSTINTPPCKILKKEYFYTYLNVCHSQIDNVKRIQNQVSFIFSKHAIGY